MLKQNDKIKIATGGEAIILEELGSGGQGIVYKVRYGGKEYALKWYHKAEKAEFYDNLKHNIENGMPSPAFLWPLFLTEKDENGCFGYLMDLRNPAYKEFGDFLLAKVHFKTVVAMIEAAIKICVGFRKLHNKGYSYQDLNDGNFFINPENGDVLICDNDNVAPSGKSTGILGKCRYMAPEIVRKEKLPDAQSDRFSLAVILFLLFFNNHPLEGEQIASCPCMTEKHEKKFYGSNPIFIYDPVNATNRPVVGIHVNVINLWPQFPKYVQDIFIDQFSQKVLMDSNYRITEKEWLEKVLLRMRHELITCPACGNEIFADMENPSFACTDCNYLIQCPPIIQSRNYKVVICKEMKIYQYITNQNKALLGTCTGNIVESKKTAGLFGLKNLTEDTWLLITKSGKTRSIAPNETVPLLVGNKISFGNGTEAMII
mgnify:CR=1 FL=1